MYNTIRLQTILVTLIIKQYKKHKKFKHLENKII